MNLTIDDLDKLQVPARALLRKLVGQTAATLFLADLEGNDFVLHARHRNGKILVKAWSSTARCIGAIAKPYRDECFVALAVRCLAKVTAGTENARRELLGREDAGLERAMRDRLARRDLERARERAGRVKPPSIFARLLQRVHLL